MDTCYDIEVILKLYKFKILLIMKLIDKDKIAAKIEKRRKSNSKNKLNLPAAFEDNYLLSFLNTLETKEVDLEKEMNKYFDDNFYITETWGIFSEKTENEINRNDLEDAAKHFFELGLKAQKGE